jgi:hypothetical protein
MPGIRTRLEQLERRTAEIRCIWLYAGWKDREGITAAGAGVYRGFVPDVPAALAPGLMAILRHPGGAEVSAATAAWALAQLALSPRQRALSAAARILVLVTAGGSEPLPETAADGAAPPGAAAEPPPAAAGPLPPPATPLPAEWPEWLPR